MKRKLAIVSIVVVAGLFIYRVSTRDRKGEMAELEKELAAASSTTSTDPSSRGDTYTPENSVPDVMTSAEISSRTVVKPPSDGEDYADKPIPNYEASAPTPVAVSKASALSDSEKQEKLDRDLKTESTIASVLDVQKIDCTGGVCSIDVTIKGEKLVGEQMAMINYLRANVESFGEKFEIKPNFSDPRSFTFVIFE